MDDQECYERYGIYDLSDVYTDEELEEIYQKRKDEYYHSPLSMESLGLTWRDFF